MSLTTAAAAKRQQTASTDSMKMLGGLWDLKITDRPKQMNAATQSAFGAKQTAQLKVRVQNYKQELSTENSSLRRTYLREPSHTAPPHAQRTAARKWNSIFSLNMMLERKWRQSSWRERQSSGEESGASSSRPHLQPVFSLCPAL